MLVKSRTTGGLARCTDLLTGLISLRAAIRRAEQHVADPRSGDARCDPSHQRMALKERRLRGGRRLGRRSLAAGSWWGRRGCGSCRRRLFNGLRAVLVIGACPPAAEAPRGAATPRAAGIAPASASRFRKGDGWGSDQSTHHECRNEFGCIQGKLPFSRYRGSITHGRHPNSNGPKKPTIRWSDRSARCGRAMKPGSNVSLKPAWPTPKSCWQAYRISQTIAANPDGTSVAL